MQVFDFMMEYFSLDAEEENEIEAIISDIPEWCYLKCLTRIEKQLFKTIEIYNIK